MTMQQASASLVETIRGIWADVLDEPTVGLSDNFFDLGGHSVLMHMVRDRLSAALGRDVDLMDLFVHPTVGTLAQYLDTSADAGAAGSEPTSPVQHARVSSRLDELRLRRERS